MEVNNDRLELIKQITEAVSETAELEQLNSIVKNNYIPFQHNNDIYRIRKLTHKEITEMELQRAKCYSELIVNKELKFEKEWIEIYKKERNIDLLDFDRDIQEIQKNIESLYMKLATMNNKREIDVIKDEIKDLIARQTNIASNKYDYLCNSIENLLKVRIDSYNIYLVLEKEEVKKNKDEESTWKKVFESFEDFEKCSDTVLIAKSINVLALLNYAINNEIK